MPAAWDYPVSSGVAGDKVGQHPRRLGDVGDTEATDQVLEGVRLEVAGVLVDPHAGDDAGDVELGVELRGVEVPTDAEHLHRAGGRRRQQDRRRGQDAAGLLVTDEG